MLHDALGRVMFTKIMLIPSAIWKRSASAVISPAQTHHTDGERNAPGFDSDSLNAADVNTAEHVSAAAVLGVVHHLLSGRPAALGFH